MANILRWGAAWSPNKEIVGRLATRAVEFMQQRRRSVTLAGAACAGVVAIAACGAGYVHYSGLAANERDAAMQAESANAALQDELGKLRDQLGATKGRLAAVTVEAQARQQQQRADAERKPAAPDANAANKGSAQLSHALDQAQRELHLTEAQRATMMARLSKAETEAQQLQAERDKLAAERDALKARVTKLEKSSMRHVPPTAEPERAVAAGAPPPAAEPRPAVEPRPAAAPQPAAAVAVAAPQRAGRSPVGEVEKVLASAGVDVARLFSQFGVSRGEGGPFVPVAKGAVPPPSSLTPEKLAALRTMMKALPVSAPLNEYEIGSPFGVRHDPFNGRTSFHTGLDFDAPYESPIYATAPGIVTYAGYRDDYGKIVEIDHGHGITTRYAHMHRYVVSVGERVSAHQQIGYLGSSGRATGPHVHYEILVNGEPQDPAKFMQLGHIVPVSQQR